MQTASLTNCKRLYELSKWGELEHGQWIYCDNELMLVHEDNDEGGLVGEGYSYREEDIIKKGFIPAYDLGYLLRKLPRYSCIEIDDVISATHTNKDHRDFTEVADTPEDACALLAIELFEQGILEKDGEVNK